MDLKYFPMDSQICNLEIESYGYSTDEVEYFWVDTNGTTLDNDISLPNFYIITNFNVKNYQMFTTGSKSFF